MRLDATSKYEWDTDTDTFPERSWAHDALTLPGVVGPRLFFLILLRFSQRPWHPTESTHLREDFLLLPPLAWYYCCPSLLQVELDLLNLSRDLASLRVLDPPTMAGQINDQKISKTSSGRWLVSQVSSAGRLALWNCWAARASSAACPKTPDCGEEATSSPEEDAAGEGLKNGELMAWFMVN